MFQNQLLTCLTNRLLPAACRVSAVAVSATLLLAGASSGYANSAYETFDSGLGNFTTTYGNNNLGFDLGWWNTGNASGFPGEMGGMFNRTNSGGQSVDSPYMPRILDTASYTSGGVLDTTMSISASGKMYLMNPGSANADINLGFFNSSIADPNSQRLVLRINAPSGGDWRFRVAADSSGSRITVPGSEAIPLDFSFTFTPSGLLDGSGSIAGSIFDGTTTYPLPAYAVTANSWTFDSFGVWTDSSGSPDLTQYEYAYFDNLQYTVVPEPSVALLLPFGAGLLVLARNKFRRR
jgi:hypothetical protein